MIYDKCLHDIKELIDIAEISKNHTHIITIFDNPYETEALSGMIFPSEIEDIEAGFVCSSKNYTGYNSYETFKKDVVNKKFNRSGVRYLIYSTCQIGIDINRRSFVPMLCKEYNLQLLTCGSYQLELLMNKAHYFNLLKFLGHIPETIIYNGQKALNIKIQSENVVLKPALECAAVGVKKLRNTTQITNVASQMYKRYKQNILIQEYIEGYEISVPVIKKGKKYISLPPVLVVFKGEILTYATVDDFKYNFKVLPDQNFPYNDVIPKLCRHSEQIMEFLETDGITRVDYRVKNSEEYYVFDIAALPVLANTGTCMQSFKYLFGDSHILFKALIGSALYNEPKE